MPCVLHRVCAWSRLHSEEVWAVGMQTVHRKRSNRLAGTRSPAICPIVVGIVSEAARLGERVGAVRGDKSLHISKMQARHVAGDALDCGAERAYAMRAAKQLVIINVKQVSEPVLPGEPNGILHVLVLPS